MVHKRTRSQENIDVDFPVFDVEQWKGMCHLPLITEVIGAMRGKLTKSIYAKLAAKEIAQILQEHWHKRNVYTKRLYNIELLLKNKYSEFMLIRKAFMKGNPSQAYRPTMLTV